MDKDTLMQLIGPEGFKALLEQTNRAATPAINVPEQVQPPPVVLHGELKVQATFPLHAIAGLTYEQIQAKVLDRLYGIQGPWMPDIIVGELRLWRPVNAEDTARAGQPTGVRAIPEGTDSDSGGGDADRGDPDGGADSPYEPAGH